MYEEEVDERYRYTIEEKRREEKIKKKNPTLPGYWG